MDAVSDPLIEEISLMAAAQVGKTEILLNIVGYYVTHDPSPILVVQPTLEMGMAWSKDRLSPMLRDTPCLVGKVQEPRSKDSSNTILHKQYPGGHITIAGANSPASLASRPVRIVLKDEPDRYPATAGTEGDPCALADKRASNFWNRKLVSTSSPTVQGVSRIDLSYNNSDMRTYFVPCPRCNFYQTLIWSQVKFDRSQNLRVWYECVHCKAELVEVDKYKMVRRGRWEAQHPEVRHHAGFHISELYSPWSTWVRVVSNFLDAKKRQETLRVWVNTTLGETWQEEESFSIDNEKLAARRENYTVIPREAYVLTAGVDVQDNRLECVVHAWGRGDECWLIDYKRFYGSPKRADVWVLLSDYLQTDFAHEIGIKLRIAAVGIDTGYSTQNVYAFCKKNQARRYFALKGYAGMGRPVVGKASRNNRQRVMVFAVGVDEAKATIYERLQIDESGSKAMHWNQIADEEFFLQLTSEKHVTKYKSGFPVKVWVLKSGRRNEVLDCYVYSLAAYNLLNVNMEKLGVKFEQQEKVLKEDQTERPQILESGDEKKPRRKVRRIRQGYLNRYGW